MNKALEVRQGLKTVSRRMKGWNCMKLDLSNYTVSEARPLPVILLLDASGSMDVNDKIKYLNQAVRDMFTDLMEDSNEHGHRYTVTVIVFSGQKAVQAMPTCDVLEAAINWKDLTPEGMTPLGSALNLAKSILEDRSVISSRSYRPMVILVSDGLPTDEWMQPLEDFIHNGRSSKCDRLAVAIGTAEDSQIDILEQFIGDAPHKVETAASAGALSSLFKRMTMTATQRSQSVNPNLVTGLPVASGIEIDPSLEDRLF